MTTKKTFWRSFLFPIISILALMLIASGLFAYRAMLANNLDAANCDSLENTMEQQRFTFASKMTDQRSVMKTYANAFVDADKLAYGKLLDMLKNMAKNSTFINVTYARASGDALEDSGTQLNIADRAYFKAAMAGETVITDPIYSKLTDEKVIIFASPVMREARTIGVLVGVYDVDALSKLLMSSFNGAGYAYVTTDTGVVIVKTETTSSLALYDNLLDAMDTTEILALDSSSEIRAKVFTHRTGHTRYRHDGEERLMHYAPVGINNWCIFSVAPNSAIAPKAVGIMYTTTLFILAMALLGTLIVIYFFFTQRRHYAELKRIAYVDSLTGADNRKRFKLVAAELLEKSHDKHYAFLLLDVDKFKVLNDALGYLCGDALLRHIADTMRRHLSNDECFGRCDSDEFLLLLRYTDDITLHSRAKAIITEIENEFRTLLSSSYSLVLCVGICVIVNPQESINSISDRARHAHTLIKGKESSGICFYNEEIRNKILQEKEIENKMHIALKNQEFLLYLQPKFYLDSDKIYGAEALVRWDNGGHTLIYPDAFIPVFEKDGFITQLDMYMLKKTCEAIRGWLDAGLTPVPVSINFSRVHLGNPNFVEDIAAIVAQYQIPPQLIEVELTESTMLHSESQLIRLLDSLHQYGFTLSMDDFGSGYSSLGLLKNLPVDVIKLDRTFLMDYNEFRRAVTIISGIITMAKALGILTVAEGVETAEQVALLRELGCDIAQGYFYARPRPAEQIKTLLNNENPSLAIATDLV